MITVGGFIRGTVHGFPPFQNIVVTSSLLFIAQHVNLIFYQIGHVCLHKLRAQVLGHNSHLSIYGSNWQTNKKLRSKWYCSYGSSHSHVNDSLLFLLHHAHRSIETLMSIVVVAYEGIQACWLGLSTERSFHNFPW